MRACALAHPMAPSTLLKLPLSWLRTLKARLLLASVLVIAASVLTTASVLLARAKGAAPGTFVGGRIINIASMAGLKVLPQIGVYCMSKAAVVHMTKAMAVEWGKYGINVNAICPGYIDTEINHHHWQTEQGQKLVSMLPRKRVGQPADLDAILVMLASNESHFVNGAVIAADDGFGV